MRIYGGLDMSILRPETMRVPLFDADAAKRPVNLSLNGDLVTRARAEGLNLSALAEEAVATALARRAREKLAAEIAQGCRAHEQYLAEYGSLADAIRASVDAE
jgi:antitoxin CcdA